MGAGFELRSERLSVLQAAVTPGNPKHHAHRVLRESMERFGFVDPILVNATTGKILAGHGRMQQLLEQHAQGAPPPAGVTEADGDWLVPVVSVPGISAEQHEAAVVALNRTVELGGWDDAALAEMLEHISKTEDGLTGVGFEESDIEELLKSTGNESSIDEGESVSGMEIQPHEHWDMVHFVFKDVRDWQFVCDALGIERVDGSVTRATRKIGVGRVLNGARLVELVKRAQ